MKPAAKTRLKLIAIFLGVALPLVACELALRTFDATRGLGFFSGHRNKLRDSGQTVIPFRTFGRQHVEQRADELVIVGRFGRTYPLEKQAGAFRIVCVGGSTTEGRPDANYPDALERSLRKRLARDDIEVINVGFSAYSTAHSLIALELELLEWDADLVLLSHNINDLTAAYFPGFRSDYSNKYSHPYYLGARATRRYSTASALFQHSQLYWVLIDRLERHTSRYPVRRTSMGVTVAAESVRVFERNLSSFVHVARANDLPVMLMSQPLQTSEELFNLHMEFKPYNDHVVYPEHEEFLAHHRQYNDVIERVADDLDCHFTDNDAHLGNEIEYFVDFVHYTPVGAERLAQHVAERIAANYFPAP